VEIRSPQAPSHAPLGSAVRSGAVYAVAAACQRGLNFLLLPLYTHVLAPAEYGRLSVLLAIAAAAIICLSFGMDTAFFRTYFALRSDPDGQQRFVTTAWAFLIVVPPVGAAALALVAAPFLSGRHLASPLEVLLALAGAALFVSATVVPSALLRAEERLIDYLLLTAVAAGTGAGFTFIAVVVLKTGVAGWLVAGIASNVITLLFAILRIPFRPRTGVDRRLVRGALRLGLPLVPHLLSHWGLGIGTRVILAGIVTTASVGIYSLASNLALPVAILLTGLATGFMPTYARAAHDAAELAALPRMITVQFLLVMTITIVGMLLGPIAVHYVAPTEYGGAAELVPWLALGNGLLGLYFMPMNAVVLTAGRTRKVWAVTVCAATVTLLSLPVLVPALGLIGAAVATTVGYLVLLVGIGLYSRGVDNPVRYDWDRFARGLLVFAAVYAAAVLTSGSRDLLDASIRLAWLAALPILLLLGRVVDRNNALAAIRRLTSRHRTVPQG
jgi:O-antigen/teichoic acid export membrane protein